MIYGYIRVSTDEQTDGTSLHTQKQAIQEKHRIDHWREDGGISGSTFFFDRPSIQGINFQAGDEIICFDSDRWSRDSLNSLKALKIFTDADVQVTSLSTGHMNKCSAAQEFTNQVLGAKDQLVRKTIIENCARGRKAKSAVQGFVGGKPPFGYTVRGTGKDSRIVKLPHYDEMINTIHDLRLDTIGYRTIAKQIEEKYGLPCSHMTIKRICEKGRKSIH